MNLASLKVASTLVMVSAALAYLVVLMLDWHQTSVEIAGGTVVHADEVGWGTWGALGGIAAVALVAANLRRLARGVEPDPTFGILDLVLGVVIVSATVAAVFTGGAQIDVAGVAVQTSAILWPGWVALALACVVAVSGAIVALPEAWQPDRRASATPA